MKTNRKADLSLHFSNREDWYKDSDNTFGIVIYIHR